MDPASERYVAAVGEVLINRLGLRLVGAYLHGSGVLGGFDARRSDVDVLVVTSGPISDEETAGVVQSLSDEALPCPARGLELSVVTHGLALHPSAQPPFELHITTSPDDPKVVHGHNRRGDADLVLHFAVCRVAGRLVCPGVPPHEAFGAVPRAMVIHQLIHELDWAGEHVPNEYAVLNASAHGSSQPTGRWCPRSRAATGLLLKSPTTQPRR